MTIGAFVKFLCASCLSHSLSLSADGGPKRCSDNAARRDEEKKKTREEGRKNEEESEKKALRRNMADDA